MNKQVVYDGKYIRVVKIDTWEFVERVNASGAVIIIPALIKNNKTHIVLIKEYRVPLQAYNISLPAGLVGDIHTENHKDAAQRELLEETGYNAGRLRYLTEGHASSGLSNELLVFYLADQLEKVSNGGGDGTEDITVQLVSIDSIDSWLEERRKEHCCIDPKIYIALYFINKFGVE
jgi:ADP-ribose pyrophosphatase